MTTHDETGLQGFLASVRCWFWLVFLPLAFHVGLLAYAATLHSPTLNEPGHLVAGLVNWKYGRFEVYNVNPPLVHYLAALPVVLSTYDGELQGFFDSPGGRPEFRMGANFIAANKSRSMWLMTLSRWACLPFSVLGALVCFFWACDLWKSRVAGVVSLWVWCFEPFLVGHAELITPDVAATSIGMCTVYCFWRWTKNEKWSWAIASGVFLGLSLSTKLTWVVFLPLLPLLFFVKEILPEKNDSVQSFHVRLVQLTVILVLGIYLLNMVYQFDGVFKKLKDYDFVSQSLSGHVSVDSVGNRFRHSLLGEVPVPFPEQFVMGIDAQKKDFEYYVRPSYLRGEWRYGGWWYYYLLGAFIKTSHGFHSLILLAVAEILRRLLSRDQQKNHAEISGRFGDFCFLVIPALVVFVLVSSQVGFNHHVRYVLPVCGFLIVFAGGAGRLIDFRYNSSKALLGIVLVRVCLLASLFMIPLNLIRVFPHQIGFFNEVAGGAMQGHRLLLHSNIDWGQDFLFLDHWVKSRAIKRPLHVVGFEGYQVENLGVSCTSAHVYDDRYADHLIAVGITDIQLRGRLSPVHGKPVKNHDALAQFLSNAEIVGHPAPSLFVFRKSESAHGHPP